MKVRALLASVILLLLSVCATAQQAKPEVAKPQAAPAEATTPNVIAPTPAQQRPIILYLRERELLNARIEGALQALIAFLGLSSIEWDVVPDGEGIKLVRRQPPATSPDGGKK